MPIFKLFKPYWKIILNQKGFLMGNIPGKGNVGGLAFSQYLKDMINQQRPQQSVAQPQSNRGFPTNKPYILAQQPQQHMGLLPNFGAINAMQQSNQTPTNPMPNFGAFNQMQQPNTQLYHPLLRNDYFSRQNPMKLTGFFDNYMLNLLRQMYRR